MRPLHSLLIQNIGALTLLQIANYVAPLLILPYLTRVLGASSFGQVAFVQVLMAWFVILVNYGFPWSATRDIAANRENHAYVSEKFAANWAAQWLLTALGGAILIPLVLMTPSLRSEADIYFAGYTIVLGQVVFPIWLFQGLERLKEVAALQVTARVVLLLLVFLLVNGPDDKVLAVILPGAGGIIAGLLSLWWIKKEGVVGPSRPSKYQVLAALREGGPVFLSQIAISFYTIFIPTALGLTAGATAVGQYSIADKLRIGAQSLMGPMSQALFPRMSYLISLHDIDSARRLFIRSLWATMVVAGSASLAIFILADWLVLIFGGSNFADAAPVLRWLAPMPLLVGLSNLFGVQIILPRKRLRAFNTILIVAAISGLLLIFPMTQWLKTAGAAITLLTVEAGVTISMAIYIKTRKLLDAGTKSE